MSVVGTETCWPRARQAETRVDELMRGELMDAGEDQNDEKRVIFIDLILEDFKQAAQK